MGLAQNKVPKLSLIAEARWRLAFADKLTSTQCFRNSWIDTLYDRSIRWKLTKLATSFSICRMASSCGNHEVESAKVEQIVNRFFSKCLHVILESKCACSSLDKNGSRRGSAEVSRRDRWFNLALRDCRLANQNTGVHFSRQMVVDLLLVHRPTANWNASGKNCDGCFLSEAAVSSGTNNHCWDMKEGNVIVIERWVMLYEGKKSRDGGFRSSGRSHVFYKKCVVMLRSLYLMLKLLPAYKLFRDWTASHKLCDVTLVHHISSFAKPFTREEHVEMQKYVFDPVETLSGSLCLSVLYRPSLQNLRIEPSYQVSAHIIRNYFGGASLQSVCADPVPVLHESCVVTRGLKSSGSDLKHPLVTDSGFHIAIQNQLHANITIYADAREISEGVMTAYSAKCQCSSAPLASTVSPSCRWRQSLETPSCGLSLVGRPTTKTSPPAQMAICPLPSLSKSDVTNFQNPEECEDPMAANLSDNAALGSLVNVFETAAPLCQNSVVRPNTGNLTASSTIFPSSPAVKTSMDALQELQDHINMKNAILQRSSPPNNFDDQNCTTMVTMCSAPEPTLFRTS